MLLAHVALTSLPAREWKDINELEVEEAGAKRHPLESQTFRSLLAEPALLRAA